MHDPMTVAFDIRLPLWWRESHPTIITIWHVDPEKDGSDDSCGWFMRARHGNKEVLERIVQRFEYNWDRTFKSESGHSYLCGLFIPNGDPHFSVHGIVLNLFFQAACEVFNSNGSSNWERARRFMSRRLFDILIFAENTTDSLYDPITRKFEIGCQEPYTPERRSERIRSLASIVYSWILRAERPWWKHPRWHIWHWKIQIHPLLHIKRWLFSRCDTCGKRFSWGESPISSSWHGTGPLWFRSEEGVRHGSCNRRSEMLVKSKEDQT